MLDKCIGNKGLEAWVVRRCCRVSPRSQANSAMFDDATRLEASSGCQDPDSEARRRLSGTGLGGILAAFEVRTPGA